jgi:micrococcal nuclease
VTSAHPGRHGIPAFVPRVIDGDTIVARFRGRTVDVRLIGINTPETVDPHEPVQCFGKASSRFTRRALTGRRVRLEFDVERLDRYGRTLAYVWTGEQLFNGTLVGRGYAQVDTFLPNVKYVHRFVAAQRRARAAERGLWRRCGARLTAARPTIARTRSRCDDNYEGACIPSYPPDLDCSDVAARHFLSVGSDPDNFDSDHDGVACET